MEKRDIFDEIIKENIDDELDKIEVPEMDDVWNNIQNHIKNENTKKSFVVNKRKTSIIAAILLISFIGLGIENTGQANYKRVLNLITKKSGEDINIDLNYTKNDPIKKEIEEDFIEYTLSLKEAQEKADFIVKIPKYVPNGYTFEKAVLCEYKGRKLDLKITYSSADNKRIVIEEKGILDDYVQSLNISQNHSTLEQIMQNGFKYNIIEKDNGRVTIIWDMFEVKYNIRGENKEELVKMALSIE